MFVATPEGPLIIDEELAALMAKTGYVASINGEQGAVDLSGVYAPLLPTVSMDFTAAPAGATPAATDTGLPVTLEYYTTGNTAPTIADLGHGKRWVAHPTADGKVATYFQVHSPDDNYCYVAAEWTQSAIDTGQVGAGGIALIMWNADYAVNVGGTPVPISRCHCTIIPGSQRWTFEVIDGANHAAIVATDKYRANPAADGKAIFRASIFIDTLNGIAFLSLPDGSVVAITDAQVTAATGLVGGWATGNTFATIPASYAVVEHFCSDTGISYAKLPEICTFDASTEDGAPTGPLATMADLARQGGLYRSPNASISAQQLTPSAFSRIGLAPNASFEDAGDAYPVTGTAGWTGSTTGAGSTIARVVSQSRAVSGTTMLALTPGGTGGGFVTYALSDLFPIQALSTYTGRALLGASGSSANGLWVRAIWYQADGVTQVSVSEITPANSPIVSNATNSTVVEGTVLAPSNACYARLQIINQTPATAVTLYVDSFDLLPLGQRGLLAVLDWAATTVYAAGQLVLSPVGAYAAGLKTVVQALIGFTSGGSFSKANWRRVAERHVYGDPALTGATMKIAEGVGSFTPGSGNEFLTMFDVPEDLTITSLNMGLVVAFAGSTLARLQVGTWDDTTGYTPLAETDDLHTALNAAGTNGIFSGPLFNSGRLASTPTSLTLPAGSRGAYAFISVGQSAGTVRGFTNISALLNRTGNVKGRQKGSMTDLPTAVQAPGVVIATTAQMLAWANA